MFRKLIVAAITTFLLCSSSSAQTILKVANGTGFFVSPNEIVTAYHAVENWAHRPFTVMYNGAPFTAVVSKYNEHLDVAYVRITGHSRVCDAPLKISAASPQVGTPYTLYGYPANKKRRFTALTGRITNPYVVQYSFSDRKSWKREFVLGDSGASSGFSGGPIVDSSGSAMGVLTNGSRRGAYFTSFEMLKNHPSWRAGFYVNNASLR